MDIELKTKVFIAGAQGVVTGFQFTEKEGMQYQVTNPSTSLWYDEQSIKDALGIVDEVPEEPAEVPLEIVPPVEEEELSVVDVNEVVVPETQTDDIIKFDE